MYGSFWSITKYQEIVDVEVQHQEFSSEAALGGFMITERPAEYRRPSFIAMDPPKHTSPSCSIFHSRSGAGLPSGRMSP
jgi:hypothetical protein